MLEGAPSRHTKILEDLVAGVEVFVVGIDSVGNADGRDTLASVFSRTGVATLSIEKTQTATTFRHFFAQCVKTDGLHDFVAKRWNCITDARNFLHRGEQRGEGNDRGLVDDKIVVDDTELGQKAGQFQDRMLIIYLDNRVGKENQQMLAEAEGRGWVNLPSKSSVLLKEKREKLSAVFVKRYVHGKLLMKSAA